MRSFEQLKSEINTLYANFPHVQSFPELIEYARFVRSEQCRLESEYFDTPTEQVFTELTAAQCVASKLSRLIALLYLANTPEYFLTAPKKKAMHVNFLQLNPT